MLLTAVNIVLCQVGLLLGSHSLLCRVQPRSCRPAQWLPAPLLQGGSVVAEHEGFYSELYAALKHIMLSPVFDSLPTGSHGRDRELSDDEWFSNAAAAARAHAEKIGDQVMPGSLPLPMTSRRPHGHVCNTCRSSYHTAAGVLPGMPGSRAVVVGQQTDRWRAAGMWLSPAASPGPVAAQLSHRPPLVWLSQAAFLKRMLAASAAVGDTGLAMGLLCVLQRVLRCGTLPCDKSADVTRRACMGPLSTENVTVQEVATPARHAAARSRRAIHAGLPP